MSPSHACKGSKRYRYYITHADAGIDAASPAWRVSAHDLERIVIDRLRAFLADSAAVHAAVAGHIADHGVGTREVEAIIIAAGGVGLELSKSASPDRQPILSRTIERVTLTDDRV